MTEPVLLAGPIVLPLAAAVLVFAGGPRTRRVVAPAAYAGMAAAAVLLAEAVWRRGLIMHAVGGWTPPLGITLRADGLAVLMVLMNTAVGIAVSIFAAGYFGAHHGDKGGAQHGDAALFWPLWFVLWGALNALFLSGDVFNLYVTLELVGLSGVGLISLAGRKAWPAAMRYLLVSLLASLSYLLGAALLYSQFGTLDIAGLGRVMTAVPAAQTAAALMFVGLMAKAALVPLHAWLPPAHAGAPAPVSAILSALVIKASFYLFLRLWFQVFPALTPAVLAQAAGVLGSAAILWGSALALRQTRLKMVVAYSTVAQIGYLFLLFPLATGAAVSAAPLAIAFHAVSHACAKAAMFMAAGSLMVAYGTDDIGTLRGAAVQASLPALAFAAGAMVLIGLPPGGNFAAKWLLVSASFDTGQWWWIPVIAAGTLLASAYLFRVLTVFMESSGSAPPSSAVRAPLAAPALALAVAALMLGLAGPAVSGLLARAPAPGLPAAFGSW